MDITFDEVPFNIAFVFFASDKKDIYRISFDKITGGFFVYVFKTGELMYQQKINWIVPPDYIAAKELLDLYIKNNKF